MDFLCFKDILTENFKKNQLDAYIKDDIIDKFYKLTELMLEKNSVMNITAIKDIEKIIPLHYADCLKIAAHIPEGAKIIDIGCGGGFPSLPLAIVRPDVTIVGVDSTSKKVSYVAETAKALDLDNLSTISARAEELITTPQMRESFDVVISRAVARLNMLNELCLPFIRVDGKGIFMKGAAGNQELMEAESGIEKLGCTCESVIEDTLWVTNDTKEERIQIIIKKTSSTPAQYPRQFGQIKKKPL